MDLLQLSSSKTLRGNQPKLLEKKTTSRTELRKKTFGIRVTDSWNSLPDDVITAPTINSFKSRLKNHWRNHPQKFKPSCH